MLSKTGTFIAIGGLSNYEVLLIVMVCMAGITIGIISGYPHAADHNRAHLRQWRRERYIKAQSACIAAQASE